MNRRGAWLSAHLATIIAVVTILLVSTPPVLVAQKAGVSIGKPANRLAVAVRGDSALVTVTGPDQDGGGVATARLVAMLPMARQWATSSRAAAAFCRADKERAPREATLYDHAAQGDRGEGKLPKVLFSCGGGRRGEIATVDLSQTSDFSASLLFASYREAEKFFSTVGKALGAGRATP